MKEVWLKQNEVLRLLKIKRRAYFQYWQKKLQTCNGEKLRNGRFEQLVLLSSLPETAQTKYYEIEKQKAEKIVEQNNKTEEKNLKALDKLNARQRESAFKRLEIIREMDKFVDTQKINFGSSASVTESRKIYVKRYNETNEEKISFTSVMQWKKIYTTKGVEGLADSYGKNKGAGVLSEWDAEAKDYFKALFLLRNVSVKQAYISMQAVAEVKGWKVPGESVAYRYVNEIDQAEIIYLREGNKAFNDKVLSYTERDPDSIQSNDVFVGDHHQFDMMIEWWDGSIVRPWLTAWFDMRSWKLVGYTITLNPNTETINTALFKALIKYGKCKYVIIDNGKDYRALHFTAGQTIRKKMMKIKYDETQKGVFTQLDIDAHFALPYNAKAKMAEPAFNILINEFDKFLPGYTGRNVNERPEKLKAEIQQKNILHISALMSLFDDYINNKYHKVIREGKYHRGKSIDAVYAENLPHRITVFNEEALRILMQPVATRTPLTIKNQVIYINSLKRKGYSGKYLVPENLSFGTKVIATYDICEAEKVYLWSEQKEFLGYAKASKMTEIIGADKSIFEDKNRYNKELKTKVKDEEKRLKPVLNAMNAKDMLGLADTGEIINKTSGETITQLTGYENIKEKHEKKLAEYEEKKNANAEYLEAALNMDKAQGIEAVAAENAEDAMSEFLEAMEAM